MSTRLALSSIATLWLCATASAGSFSVSGPGGAIPDFAGGAGTWNISYTGAKFTSTVTVQTPVTNITKVKISGLNHTYRGDLQILLQSPAGNYFTVVSRAGWIGAGSGDDGDYLAGVYDIVDTGGGTVAQGSTNISGGTYNAYFGAVGGVWTGPGIANIPLARITGGSGVWTLEIRDWVGLDTGSVTSWTLEGTSLDSTCYGISNGFGTPADNQIYQINPVTGAVSGAVQVTLPTFTVSNAHALAAHPGTGVLYAVIQTTVPTTRRLVTINPVTGVASQIGALANQISTIAFKPDGTLLGVSGDGGAPPETLYSISTANAALTLLFALGNGADGESIATHPNGLVYHSSGNGTAEFESIDVGTATVTPLGSAFGESFGIGYSAVQGKMYLTDIGGNLNTVNLANGARTLIGPVPSISSNRAVAFVENVPSSLVYGISNGFGTPANNQIYRINPATGAISGAVQVTLAASTVSNSLSLAAHPATGVLYAVIQTTSPTTRRLVTIDPGTGVCTQVGPLTNQISTLAFKSDGTLLGVSGDGGSPSETLYSISTANAALTLLFALGNGLDGETIASHPSGIFYHSSGNGTAEFESVDVNTMVVTPLGIAAGECFAMGYSAALGRMYLSDISSNLYTVNLANGARTLVGNIPVIAGTDNRGLAFVERTPTQSFCTGNLPGSCAGCANNGSVGRGCANSVFASGTLLTTGGVASISNDTLVLSCSEMPGPGLFFQSNGIGPAFNPFGDGMLCANIGIIRMGVVFQNANSQASYPGGNTPAPIHIAGAPVSAGDTKHYQCWYRDNPPFCTPATFNTSNGVSLTWIL